MEAQDSLPGGAERLNSALAQITKTPALTAGVLKDATEVIVKEGCLALGTTRVGIWRVNYEKLQLENITSYSVLDHCHTVQEDFPFAERPDYIRLLNTERLIIINNADEESVLSNLKETYGPELASLLDAPIRMGGELVGVVCIEQFHKVRRWSLAEQNFASSLADFTALALESAERYQAMQELDLSNRRTVTLMSNLPGMVYQCLNDPPSFTFTFVSEGCRALTGYSPEELMHNNALRFFDMIHPEDVEALAEINKVTLSVGLPLETTFRMIMKDGSIKWIWERSRVVEFNTDGTPRLLEGFYTDITEQRRLEAAELANRAKSEFLANMSHEIRTPMNAILGMTDLAIKQFNRAFAPEGRGGTENTLEYLHNIKTAANSLLTIINDILDFSKIEARAVEIAPEPYDLASFLNDIVTMIHIRIGDKPLDFLVEDSPALPRRLVGDPTRLKQIMVNLLTNAVKFTKSGHVKLRLSTVPAGDSGSVVLKVAVEDTGIGIKREDLPLLFETFSQVDTKKNRNVEGTGLGLAISRNLLELMGGSISVDSVYGKGSTFSFEVVQGVADQTPLSCLPEAGAKKAAVWLDSRLRAESLRGKLEALGVSADIVNSLAELSGEYTHLFFDHNNYSFLLASSFPNATLVALARTYLEDKEALGRSTLVSTPLTSNVLVRLLGGENSCQTQERTEEGGRLVLDNARLLVVDDNAINTVIAESLLLEYGASVDIAESGKEALALLTTHDYDLVFMDHMMPEMDGVEATQHIRSFLHEKYRRLPIVALTANAIGDARVMFLESGMNDFVAKPLDIQEIERVLKQWLPREKWRLV